MIITSENEQNLDLNDLKKFVIDNSIPIYFIEKLIYDKIFNFFLCGKCEYYSLYSNKNMNNENDVFKIFRLSSDNNYEKKVNENSEENIKYIPKNRLEDIKNKIEKNKFYKMRICPYYMNKECKMGENCNFAHNEEELNEVKKIRNYYLINKNKEKDEILKKYAVNCEKLYDELKNEFNNLFHLSNIKKSKRLIIDIFI